MTQENKQLAVLVAIGQPQQAEETKEHLDELAFLAETAGIKTIKRFVQHLSQPDSRTFVGKGKLELAGGQRGQQRRPAGRRRGVDLKALLTEKPFADADHEWCRVHDRDGADADLCERLRARARRQRRDTERRSESGEKFPS